MPNFLKHSIQNNDFILHSSRVIFWEQEKILILSDVHFGKIAHFRKNGISVPNALMKEDIQRLFEVIQFFKPLRIIIVGDLFHSVVNKEHELFMRWRNDLAAIDFVLIKGNHDIVSLEWYEKANIKVIPVFLKVVNIIFVHQLEDYQEEIGEKDFLFCGHVHPAIIIKGLGRQTLRFPCFYFTKKYSILPAFGKFTGTFLVEPKKSEQAFAVVNNDVIKIS